MKVMKMEQENQVIEVLQWFFDLDTMVKACNWPVDVEVLVDAKRSLEIKQHLFCKSRSSEVGHLASMFR
jgi:hypothetical protein